MPMWMTFEVSDYGVPSSLPRPGWTGFNTATHKLQLTGRIHHERENAPPDPPYATVAHIAPEDYSWYLCIHADKRPELLIRVDMPEGSPSSEIRWGFNGGIYVPPTDPLVQARWAQEFPGTPDPYDWKARQSSDRGPRPTVWERLTGETSALQEDPEQALRAEVGLPLHAPWAVVCQRVLEEIRRLRAGQFA